MTRLPAVAGQFYPAEPDDLSREIQRHILEKPAKSRVIGVVVPHAGFMYSGDAAGAVYSRIEIPDTVIILGPNHTGQGERISIMTHGTWTMPFGNLEIDSELAQAICEESFLIRPDVRAHLYEHSIETQIPFLQYFKKEFRIVPICLMRATYQECVQLAKSIVRAVSRLNRSVLFVASSDMTHYEPHDLASQKDRKAIEQILKLDPKGLYETVEENNITMCGIIPVTVMLLCANQLGATRSELVKYMTSGEVSGDYDQVVGYAGMIVQ